MTDALFTARKLDVRRARLAIAIAMLGSGALVACGSTRAPQGTAQASATPNIPTGGVVTATEQSGSAAPAQAAAFSKQALLAATADCALGRLRDFQNKAQALAAAADAWAHNPLDAAAKESAQNAWKVAMASWQEMELFRFGPAAAVILSANPGANPGAQGLRDEIDPFPHRNLCTIDQQTASMSYRRSSFSTSAPAARGLGAFEYLAFSSSTMHACTGFAANELDKSWGDVSAQLPQLRAEYSAVVANDVVMKTQRLAAAWDNNFVQALTQGTAPYSDQKSALNAVFDAMSYLDKEVRDYKLGRPMRLNGECVTPGIVCGPEALESPFAGVSIENVRINLKAFQRVFQGCEQGSGLGFDDWLTNIGAGMLAEQVSAALSDAQATADSFPALEPLAATDATALMPLYTTIKTLTGLLNAQMLSVLELNPPAMPPRVMGEDGD